MFDTSVYLHIPFCRHRCAYCDFNTYAGLDNLIPAYVEALCREVEVVTQSKNEKLPVHTIYLGGGTPSLLEVASVDQILQTVRKSFQVKEKCEITLEANPGTVRRDQFKELLAAGINRISFGMQSANQAELTFLERQHSLQDVYQTMEWARQAGIHNLSLDLIFGLPGQTLESWQKTLKIALAMEPGHLSLYSLTVEEGTPLNVWVQEGKVAAADADLAADLYEESRQVLGAAGYYHYEISNWARTGEDNLPLVSRHNLQYWLNRPYFGFGAGAHGYIDRLRIANVSHPKIYIQKLAKMAPPIFPRSPATNQVEPVDGATEMKDHLMLGLRLVAEGVSDIEFRQRFGLDIQEVFGKPIQKLVQQGLVEWIEQPDRRLRLTSRGQLLGNWVFREFV